MATDPRQLRDDRDRGSDAGRSRGRGRGSYMNYYDEIGAATTEEGHSAWQAEDQRFQGQVKEANTRLAASQAKYDQANAQYNQAFNDFQNTESGIPQLDAAVNQAWNSARSGFVPVNVVSNGSNIEGTYYLPQEAVQKVWADTAGYYKHQTYLPNGQYNIDVQVTGGGQRGGELHQMLSNAETAVKTSFWSTAVPKISSELGLATGAYNAQMAEGNSQFAEAKANLDKFGAQIAGERSYISGVEKQREGEKQKIRDDYQKRLSTLREIFGGVKIDKAE